MSDNKSTLEYLQVLVDEWWINNLRRKITPSSKDKKYFNKVCALKKARIIEICDRNEMPSIFSDKELMKSLNKKFNGKGGMPIFTGATETDEENYYAVDKEVRCFYGFEDDKPIIKTGLIKFFDKDNGKVLVKFNDVDDELLLKKNVSRIF
jgi:hypothetical protein